LPRYCRHQRDKTHLHFGVGQTETLIELTPGKHTLQLVLGDTKHDPFNPPGLRPHLPASKPLAPRRTDG
jgi:Domain of unknown function (DUF4399)